MLLNDCKNERERLMWTVRLTMETLNDEMATPRMTGRDFFIILLLMLCAGGFAWALFWLNGH